MKAILIVLLVIVIVLLVFESPDGGTVKQMLRRLQQAVTQEPQMKCPGGLHRFKDGCADSLTINFMTCTEGRGISLEENRQARLGGRVTGVAGMLDVAREVIETENTAVARDIVKGCLEFTRGNPAVPEPQKIEIVRFVKELEDRSKNPSPQDTPASGEEAPAEIPADTPAETPAETSIINELPEAIGLTNTVDAGGGVLITLQGSDAGTCDLDFSITTGPTSGTLSSITNQSCSEGSPNSDTAELTYTHSPSGSTGSDSTSPDSFTYEVCDDATPQGCAEANVSIAITPN